MGKWAKFEFVFLLFLSSTSPPVIHIYKLASLFISISRSTSVYTIIRSFRLRIMTIRHKLTVHIPIKGILSTMDSCDIIFFYFSFAVYPLERNQSDMMNIFAGKAFFYILRKSYSGLKYY